MKKVIFLLMIVSLFLLSGCDAEDEKMPEVEGGWDPLSCATATKSSEACGIDWFITFKISGFPDNIQILLNDTSIIDECDPQSNWSKLTSAQRIEFKITDFANLDGKQRINMRVYDRHDCFKTKTEMSNQVNQDYVILVVNGEKRILIEK